MQWELDHIGYPSDWAKEEPETLQVAIIGAGMAGIASAYSLYRVGIHNIALFDECEEGKEGPWMTYGKMKVLRTGKDASGPSLFTPSLTFQAWYEANHGIEAWNLLTKASPHDFADYLYWMRSILKLPVHNQHRLSEIIPCGGRFLLKFENKAPVYAQKIVLATGRKGFGGYEKIPGTIHTSDLTDYSFLNGKKVAILGCGTAAFDAAGEALEANAKSVDMIFRRNQLPSVNKADALAHVGMEMGFHRLPDRLRFQIIQEIEKEGTPPPEEAIKRISSFTHFHMRPKTTFTKSMLEDFDFVIAATGYHIDAFKVPELNAFAQHIKLWKDRLPEDGKLANFPYLGDHFQFLEKQEGSAPFLKNIYCFNYGALVSHGLVSSAIDPLSTGALRLAEGIASDFFLDDIESFLNHLQQLE